MSAFAEFAPSPDVSFDQETSDAYDWWRSAIDEDAEAENEYLRLFQIAWVAASVKGVPVTIRAKDCDNVLEVCEAKKERNLAAAKEKRCRSKVDQLRERSIRFMAHEKRVAGQT